MHYVFCPATVVAFLMFLIPARSVAIPAVATTYFKVFDLASGLPDNSVNDITEDNLGFIWVATWNGLARLDGKNITTYRCAEDGSTISNNMVRCLFPTETGLWVGTDQGIDFFRFSDCRFFHGFRKTGSGELEMIKNRVSRIFGNDRYLFILTGDGDILRLDLKEERRSEKDIVFSIIARPNSRIYADLVPFTNGRIMAASNEGVTVLSHNGESELLHNTLPRPFDNNINIYCDTIYNKVYIGSGIGCPMTVHDIVSTDGKLSAASSHSIDGLMKIAATDDGVYLATDGSGLYHIDRRSGEQVHYRPNNPNFPCDALYTVFVDSYKNVWCGSYRHGLFMASHELNTYTVSSLSSGSISYDIVTAISPVDDKLFLGLDGGGLDVYDTKTGRSRNFNSSNSSLPGPNIVSLLYDGNLIWGVDYSGGLFEMSPQTYEIQPHPTAQNANRNAKYWVIADDGLGNIWIGQTSLLIFNKATHTFTEVQGATGCAVMSIVDGGDFMWVGTRDSGIFKVNKRTHKIEERYSDSPSKGGVKVPGYHAKFLFIDSYGILWANIANKYFCSISPGKDSVPVFYDASNGIGNRHVLSMIEDEDKNLWLGTDNGLYKYIRARNTFVRRNNSRMPSSYTPQATAYAGGNIYFGTTSGLLSFKPDDYNRNSEQIQTVFTGIRILDEEYTEIPLYTHGDKRIELNADQNFFIINFSAPDMSNSEQMQFECRLDGLEDIWHDASAIRSATYTNVPAGDYTLLVKHTNPDGSWTEPVCLDINIKPHWYDTNWMRVIWLVLILAFVALSMSIWSKYIKNTEKTKLVEIERDSIKQLNDAKLNFYANITHELRTPCFLISAQIEELFDSGRQSVPVSSLVGVYRNSAKLNKLINHIIDFRKNDTGNLQLNPYKIELVSFLKGITSDYEQLCRQKSHQFTFMHDTPPIEVDADPDKLEQIVSNLISNSYKYTPKGGIIELAVRDKGDKVVISITDNGIGIVEKLQSKIFEPFYRTERGRSQGPGDGIGLAFVKQLVELHHGTITVESRVNEGSVFTVTLPKVQGKDIEGVHNGRERSLQPILPLADGQSIPDDNLKIHNPTAIRSMLIVDDNPQILTLLGHVFDDEYSVSTASDGKEAFEMAKEGDFDVIITDLKMPEIDGHTLTSMLRANGATKKTKIVIFSAVTSEEDVLSAYKEGVDIFITKPTSLKLLRMQVDRLFEETAADHTIKEPQGGVYNREEQKFLMKCRSIIDECMTDENFGIDMLAGRLAMSHSSLYKKIRRMTGMSLIEFINEYRIYKAVAMFRNGNTNVQKVAEACGFRDIKTFRETFKRKMDIPPKQFILKMNNPSAE